MKGTEHNLRELNVEWIRHGSEQEGGFIAMSKVLRISGKMRFVSPVALVAALGVMSIALLAPFAASAQAPEPVSASAPGHSVAGIEAATFPLPQGLQDEPGAQEFRAGREAALQRRWQEALRHFEAVIEENPGTPLVDDATYWAARCQHELGNHRAAVERVNQLIDQYPDSSWIDDAKVLRIDAATILVREGEASYSRYLREAAAAPVPPAPAAGVRPNAQPVPAAEPAPVAEPAMPVMDVPAPEAPAPTDPETELRLYALNALVGMGADEAWPLLRKVMANSDDPVLRRRAIMVLGQVDHPEAFEMLVELARSDTDLEVRREAVFWLSQSSGHSDEAAQVLAEIALAPGDEELRQRAVFALAQTDSARAQETLRRVALDTSMSSEIRGAALMWISQSDEPALDFLRQVIASDPDLEMRKRALFGVSQIEDEEAARYLLELARTDDDPEIRKAAVFFLVQRDDVASVDLLVELFDQETDPEIRQAVLFSLGQATDNDAAITKLIDVAKNDPDLEMRQAAVMWLGQSDDPRARQALIEIIGSDQ
jgi:HEAT repeat protein